MPKLWSVKEEIYSHEYLWRCASRLLARAEAEEEESFFFLLPSLLMSFMAFEAFVNFCGFVLDPEKWKDEKKHFKGKGIEGKLDVIVSKLPSFSWRKGEPPYDRIKALGSFRDIVAHAKVVATQYVTERKEDGSHIRYEHPWDRYISVDVVKNARADIKSFCQSLLLELRKKSGHPHLRFDAFEGSFASASGEGK